MKNNEEEIWRDIKDFEGYYQVSDQGRVKQLARHLYSGNRWYDTPERILEPFIWQSPYLRVELVYKLNGVCKRRATYVHTLVAETYIGPRPECCVIDHINRERTDNRACNLRYVTQCDNLKNVSDEYLQNKHKPVSNETKLIISIKTKEAMWDPEVHSKLGSGVRGKHWYLDKETNKHVYYS